MKTQITKYILTGLIIIFGFAGWLSVSRAISVPNSSTWLIPIIWFSLFFVALTLGAIIIKKKIILISALAVSFLLSLIFTFTFWHVLVLIISFFLAFSGIQRISIDSKLNIKLNIIKSIRVGKAFLILALSIAITSQYYFGTKNTPRANIIPKFQADYLTSGVVSKIYPDIAGLENENLTVDQFITKISQKNSKGNTGEKPAVSKEDQERILQESRKNFSKIAGVELTGQEKAKDAISEAINNRISSFFSPNFKKNNSTALPWIISFILFLTVASLGSFFAPLAGYLAAFIFWLLRKAELVKVFKKMVEMEMVE